MEVVVRFGSGVQRDVVDQADRANLGRNEGQALAAERAGERGAEARAYLKRRGFSQDAIEGSGLGLVPAAHRTREVLTDCGYAEAQIAAAGVVADSRWPGRLCGAWRTEYGRVGTLWARALDAETAAEIRYLYLRGASRTNLPPYGFSDVGAGSHDARSELVLVEGFIDFHQLRAHGLENVAALGGTSSSSRTFERLSKLGVEAVTVCLDNDEAGRAATTRAVDNSTRAQKSPAVYVVSPDRLGDAKDPDAFVQSQGTIAWPELLATRECGIGWRARQLVADVKPDGPLAERREALDAVPRLPAEPPPAPMQLGSAIGLADLDGEEPEPVRRRVHAHQLDEVGRPQGVDRPARIRRVALRRCGDQTVQP